MAVYTNETHWQNLRGSRSMKIIGAVSFCVYAVDWAIGFFRGSNITLKDIKDVLNKIPGDPLVWTLGITVIALAAVVVAIFHETRLIVQSKMNEHETATKTLTDGHTKALQTVQSAHNTALEEEQKAHEETTAALTDKCTEVEDLTRLLTARAPQPFISWQRKDGYTGTLIQNLSSDIDAEGVKIKAVNVEPPTFTAARLDRMGYRNERPPIPFPLLCKSATCDARDHMKCIIRPFAEGQLVRIAFTLEYSDYKGSGYERDVTITGLHGSFWDLGDDPPDIENGPVRITQLGRPLG